MSKPLVKLFNDLLSHLNSEEDAMAVEFRAALLAHLENVESDAKVAAKDALWRECLENGGVDNWSWYSESLSDGGYFDLEDDE